MAHLFYISVARVYEHSDMASIRGWGASRYRRYLVRGLHYFEGNHLQEKASAQFPPAASSDFLMSEGIPEFQRLWTSELSKSLDRSHTHI